MEKIKYNDLFCKFCGKECKNKKSLIQHEIRCKDNPNRVDLSYMDKIHSNNKGRIPWNKGLTKETDERIKKYSLKQKLKIEKFGHTGCFGLKGDKNIACKKEVREKISCTAKLYHSTHENLKVGKGKRGWYKGIYCQSSWELAYVIYQLEHNVNIIRNKRGFSYFWNNKEHTYFPDFYLPDINQYVEIKGYYSDRDKEKIKQFTEKIIVLERKDLEFIFDYVIGMYGNDYINLYE